jgi:hypothetical protein
MFLDMRFEAILNAPICEQAWYNMFPMPFKNPEVQKAYDKQKYEKNRERLLWLRKKRHEENKESENAYMSAYQKENRSSFTDYHRNWRKNRTPEQVARENESTRKWRKMNPQKLLATVDRWQKKNPEKAIAHAALFMAVKVGIVIRPDSCSKCGKKCKPHGHHTDYSKMLEVVWLCPKCHKDAHLSELRENL